jgi:4-amino-4-deoxy-L-arabinose transferase-like glycosyltransferase
MGDLKMISRSMLRIWYVAIFLGAFLIRLWFVMQAPVKPSSGGDPRVYEETAINILSEGLAYSEEGYAFRSPLYPHVIAMVYALGGRSHTNLFILQALIGSLTASLLLNIGLRLLSHFCTAFMAATLFAIHPVILYYTKQVLTESLYMFFLVLVVYLAYKVVEKPQKGSLVLLGLAMGLTILCRAEGSLFSGLVLVGMFAFTKGDICRKFHRSFIIVFTMLLAVAPWVIRNCLVVGAPVLATEGGITLYLGNNPEATGGYHVPSQMFQEEVFRLSEVEKSRFYTRKAVTYILENPAVFILSGIRKLQALWGSWGNRILLVVDWLLLPPAISGLLFAVSSRNNLRSHFFLLCPLAAVTILSIVFIGQSRFRAPIYPFLMFFATVAIERICLWVGSRRQTMAIRKL